MKKTILTGILFLSAAAGFAQTPITREQTDRMVMDTIAARGIQYWMLGIHKDGAKKSTQDSLLYFVYEYDESLRATSLYLAFSTADGSCRSWMAPTPDGNNIDNWECYSNLPRPKNEALFDFSAWMDNPPTNTHEKIIGGNAPQNYAVIISGGVKISLNPINFWNDCAAMYSTLVYAYGYAPENIYVLISDGTDPSIDTYYFDNINGPKEGFIPMEPGSEYKPVWISSPIDLDKNGINDVKYSASKENISIVFNLLAEKVSEQDHVFIFVTDHGGKEDEEAYIALWNHDSISVSGFAKEIDKVPTQNINILMGQCYSGDFIPAIATEGRTISTSAPAGEVGWYYSTSNYTEFAYHWISAALGHTPDGVHVDADYNNDGRKSIHELFLYAQKNDTLNKNPQYASWPDNLGDYVSLNGLDACPETTLVNATVSSDRTVNGCSVEVSYSTVKSGKKLTINHEISTELGLGFSMEPGSELEIK